MMSLTMMGLDPGLLVRVLFLFTMKNILVMLTTPLVVFVAWVLEFLFFFVLIGIESIGDVFLLVMFVPKVFESKVG